MDVLMPQLGETVSEGKIIKWFKSVGEPVAAGENLCEIETDKVTVEVPALAAGIVNSINAEVGVVAPVGTVIAVLGDTAAPAEATTPAPAGPAVPPLGRAIEQVRPPSPATRRELDPFHEVQTPRRSFGPARLMNGIRVTPLARRLAADAAIDLAGVAGSGPHGRITGRDIKAAIAAKPVTPPSLTRTETFEELIGEAHRARPHTVEPVDGMRRTIARRLAEAKATIPHFYVAADVEIDRLLRVREEINAGARQDVDGTPDYKLSINDFMIKALALALQEVPRANAIWSGSEVLTFEHSDVGVAVAVPGGLLTPVIVEAEGKTLSAISNEMNDLAARARSRSLQPDEYQGGTTTLSNLGMHRVREFAAIINPPQSTILAVGGIRREATETDDGDVAFAGRITATLSCDHRVVDGVVGADLLDSFRVFIENPLRMVA